ncbi:DUF4345 domain-containing protein [Roseivirga sp.]|uniref:DUF4345 domain-containing protein n=1 Tax=Roseivirga sp. TaxID=1964215 RepID=UPI003B8C937E
MDIFNIVVLALSGLMLTFAGFMRFLKPIGSYCLKSYADNPELKIEGKSSMFSEMRGAGLHTVFAGITILLGTLLPQLQLTSFIVSSIFYVSYAIGRSVSLSVDGKPNQQTFQGMIFEIILGGLNVFCLVKILL